MIVTSSVLTVIKMPVLPPPPPAPRSLAAPSSRLTGTFSLSSCAGVFIQHAAAEDWGAVMSAGQAAVIRLLTADGFKGPDLYPICGSDVIIEVINF